MHTKFSNFVYLQFYLQEYNLAYKRKTNRKHKLNYVSIIHVIDLVKALDNKQCPFDWFITHDNTKGFKQDVTTYVIAHTLALGIVCY
jgi:hypothetical protein